MTTQEMIAVIEKAEDIVYRIGYPELAGDLVKVAAAIRAVTQHDTDADHAEAARLDAELAALTASASPPPAS